MKKTRYQGKGLTIDEFRAIMMVRVLWSSLSLSSGRLERCIPADLLLQGCENHDGSTSPEPLMPNHLLTMKSTIAITTSSLLLFVFFLIQSAIELELEGSLRKIVLHSQTCILKSSHKKENLMLRKMFVVSSRRVQVRAKLLKFTKINIGSTINQ